MIGKTGFLLVLLASLLSPIEASGQVTTIMRTSVSETSTFKINVVFIGDGFMAAEQDTFNTIVEGIVDGLFDEVTGDIFRETALAFNIYRVNVNSVQTGITTLPPNLPLNIVITRFGYQWTGTGPTFTPACAMQPGTGTTTALTGVLNTQVPAWDIAVVILNTALGANGCARSNGRIIELSSTAGWGIMAHELGHSIGDLGDEYGVNNTAAVNYALGEPVEPNLTRSTNLATLLNNKPDWADFVHPSTPTPTTNSTFLTSTGAIVDPVNDVGLFVGGTIGPTAYNNGIFRPTFMARMWNNIPPFGPLNDFEMRNNLYWRMAQGQREVYVGRFSPDNSDDIVIRDGVPGINRLASVSLYTGNVDQLDTAWVRTRPPGDPAIDTYRWTHTPKDQFFVGDFDADGQDDLYVFNDDLTIWDKPYLAMLRGTANGFEYVKRFDGTLGPFIVLNPGDRFFVADVDRDGRDDLIQFQPSGGPLLVVMRSTGTDLEFASAVYEWIPSSAGQPSSWHMSESDQFYVADFDADGRDDLYVNNRRNWSVPYLGMLRSNSTGYEVVRKYSDVNSYFQRLPLGRDTQYYVADFDGNGREDLYMFNGGEWDGVEYLEMLASGGDSLRRVSVFSNDTISGWEMKPNDRFFVADFDGDQRSDLYVFNALDWGPKYLGMLSSSGNSLSAVGREEDQIGLWNLGSSDKFKVADFNGDGLDDLFVHFNNARRYGLFRSSGNALSESSHYEDWIHNVPYHRQGWW